MIKGIPTFNKLFTTTFDVVANFVPVLRYDPDAQAYFTAVEAVGGSFDLSGIYGYDSDFSAGVDGFGGNNVTLAGNIDANADGAGVPPSDDWLRVTSIDRNQFTASIPLDPLRYNTSTDTFTLTVQVYLPAGHEYIGNATAMKMRLLGGTNQEILPNETPVQGSQTITYTIPLNGTSHNFIAIGGGATVSAGQIAYYKDFQLRNTAYSTYTESYVKTAHSNFYTGLKTDDIWDKLAEFYLQVGKTFDGLSVKGKGTGSLINNNFVTGDWLGAGPGAGLKGDGATKYLRTGYSERKIDPFNSSLSVYVTTAGVKASTNVFIGALGDIIYSTFLGRAAGGTKEAFESIGGFNTRPMFETAWRTGVLVGSARANNDRELYRNGSSIAVNTDTQANSTTDFENFSIFANSTSQHTDATITFAHIGTGLTDTDVSNLSSRINALMTALGCNVY